MKKRILKVVTLIAVMGLVNVNYSQENQEKIKKHAIGVDYNFNYWNLQSFDYNYRYYLNKFNIKAAVEVVIPNNYDFGDNNRNYSYFLEENQPELVSNIDSTGKFYGLDENYFSRGRYVKLKVGAEKLFLKDSKINLLLGADLYLGSFKQTRKSNVNYYQLDSTENKGATYWDNPYNKFGVFISEENTKTTEQKNIVLGLEINTGLVFNISKRFFGTAILSYRIGTSISQKLNNTYKNSNFENSFSANFYDVTYFSNSLGGSLGINYRL